MAEGTKKKRRTTKEENKEKTEEVTPLTAQEKVSENLADWLKAAALSRTLSLTLDGLGYADQLSTALLTHATDIEKEYKEIQKSLKSKNPSCVLEKILTKMEAKVKEGEKLQVGKVHQFQLMLLRWCKSKHVWGTSDEHKFNYKYYWVNDKDSSSHPKILISESCEKLLSHPK